jgi:hypothetical protein
MVEMLEVAELFRGTHNIWYLWVHHHIHQIWIFYGYIKGFINITKSMDDLVKSPCIPYIYSGS